MHLLLIQLLGNFTVRCDDALVKISSQNSALSLDIERFELLMRQASDLVNAHDPGSLESILENAIGTYKGDLYPSCKHLTFEQLNESNTAP